ncbi:MAG TPA: hypothetical protein VLF18_09580 [Tahibacter sp.]|uniref:hypothetical protein n=1 Tax=Tahibacter sp. TaxID=2056211 RepID=UPI002CB7A0A7|nr:hypothetical protein [Tahibacter sp.]HSX60435.1 hypothetical protein [Tahibacter sp.]
MKPRWQIAFLTGQSDPRGCALSDVQRAFLAGLSADRRVATNFPYDAATHPFLPTPLLRASLSNARQYFASRTSAFRARHRPPVERMLDGADRSLLLAGSCGLELLNNLQLPRVLLDRIAVFAYGPVARRRPDCETLLVQGRRDLLSRCWFRDVDHRVDAGHMDYLFRYEVLQHCRALLHRLGTRA